MKTLLHEIFFRGLVALSFWLREIAGWMLVMFGLIVLYRCYLILEDRRPIEAGSYVIIGVVVFRGGIHLLKVALAARICHEARERTKPQQKSARPAAPVNRLAVRGPSEPGRPTASR